jgi:glycosyltransferase involved in cell wall biosynthesis
MKLLWVSDIPGWAYDSGYRGLKRVLPPEVTLDTCFFRDAYFGRINLRGYDVVFLWSWFEVDPPRIYWPLLNQLDPDKTILCVASDRFVAEQREGIEKLGPFRFLAGNNQKVTDAIKKAKPNATVHTLDYGVDLGRFTSAPFPAEFTVGWAGNPRAPRKRLTMAKSICAAAGVPLKVAGHPFYEEYVKPDDMPAWYHSISALLITSTSEVHPCIYYEALASGRPVVSTLVGDIPDTAEDYGNGVYFPVDAQEAQFVWAIRNLKDHPDILAKMGEQARWVAEMKWGWERIAPKYLSYAEEVTSHI